MLEIYILYFFKGDVLGFYVKFFYKCDSFDIQIVCEYSGNELYVYII